jgi:3-phosphoshikimate 1-carboxyvinyltransferase
MVANKLTLRLKANNKATTSLSCKLPLSKSVSNRVQIINAANGFKSPENLISSAGDSKYLALGLQDFFQKKTHINAGEGGTTFRFLLAFFALHCKQKIILEAEGPMLSRPIKPLVDSLLGMGCRINYLTDKPLPPVEIHPPKNLKNSVEISGLLSSQFISAIALSAAGLKQKIHLKIIEGLSSKSYLQLTLALLNKSGCSAHLNNNIITVEPNDTPEIFNYAESDWSSAQYIFQLAALNRGCNYTVEHISKNDLQADKEALKIFSSDFGLQYSWQNNTLKILADNKYKKPVGLVRDFSNNPDLAQAWLSTAFALEIEAKAMGLSTLNHKETNRILALNNELQKLGARVAYEHDWLSAFGSPENQKKTIETYQDHRMAMSFAPLVYKLNEITINAPYVVTKSFPNFWKLFDQHCDLNFHS